jgi:methyltransferase (TIGR00027 family)
MTEKGPSQTAIRTAMRRAAHYLLDAEPKILADGFARALAGFSTDEEFLRAFQAVPNAHIPWLRMSFALRNRLAEDELAKAVKQGTTQYIILGAGLDSFAYRQPDLVRSLDVYEVDHPASQAWKRERVRALGIPVPPTLHYAPVDFERTSLTEGLTTAGLKRHESAFFTWLGVTQYLTRDAVLRTMREVAALSTAEKHARGGVPCSPPHLERRGGGFGQLLGGGVRHSRRTVAQFLHIRRHARRSYPGGVQVRRTLRASRGLRSLPTWPHGRGTSSRLLPNGEGDHVTGDGLA